MKIDRHYSSLLHRYLTYFPCVVLLGPRQCGKTTLLETLPDRWHRYDLEKPDDFKLIQSDPYGFLRNHPRQITIDEAQLAPDLFPALRVIIDQERDEKGRFVLTGSSSLQLTRAVHESLAGRVGVIEMGPLLPSEAVQKPVSVFYGACLNRLPLVEWVDTLAVQLTPAQIRRFWFEGGFPEPWLQAQPDFHRAWMQSYIQNHVERDLQRLFPGLDAVRFRQFLEMLAALSGTILNYSDIARHLGVSAPTVKDYVLIAEGLLLWRSLPAWSKNQIKRLVKHPKGALRDTGLLHHWLRIPVADALEIHPQRGASWEALVTETLIQGFSAQGERVHPSYYRTRAGVEVDLILEGSFGTLPIEIKAASSVDPRALGGLRSFMDENACPQGIVIFNGDRPQRLSDNIAAIPLGCL